MKLLRHIITIVCILAIPAAGADPQTERSLDKAGREEIIAAALRAQQAQRKAAAKPAGTEIAKEHWGETIERLKPLRVTEDRMNVFIVLKEDATAEEGLYVINPFSSYAPRIDKRFVALEMMTKPEDKSLGIIYRCEIRKSEPPVPSKGK